MLVLKGEAYQHSFIAEVDSSVPLRQSIGNETMWFCTADVNAWTASEIVLKRAVNACMTWLLMQIEATVALLLHRTCLVFERQWEDTYDWKCQSDIYILVVTFFVTCWKQVRDEDCQMPIENLYSPYNGSIQKRKKRNLIKQSDYDYC